MVIPINDLIVFEEDNWEAYLKKICFWDIFEKLVEEYFNQPEVLRGIIRYIVWAYSLDSSKIALKRDWLKNKEEIFKYANLPKIVYEDVVLLKSKTVLDTAKKFLTYQDEENFTNWAMINDLIVELRIAANSPIKKSSGEIDYKTKQECAESVLDLLVSKERLEQKFIQSSPKLAAAYKEVQTEYQHHGGNVMGIETIVKERAAEKELNKN